MDEVAAECTCDVTGLTCQYGGGSFRCSHDELDCDRAVECDKTHEYAEVCADVADDHMLLRIVRAEEPVGAPCPALMCSKGAFDIVLRAAAAKNSSSSSGTAGRMPGPGAGSHGGSTGPDSKWTTTPRAGKTACLFVAIAT